MRKVSEFKYVNSKYFENDPRESQNVYIRVGY